MTTHHKTRTGGRPAGLGTVGHGFSHDINPARSAFLSRCLSLGPSILDFPLCFGCRERFFAPARGSSVFAFVSQNAPKSAKNYSTLHVERNTLQVIENNQRGYALLDTLRGSRSERNRERKINEDPPLRKPQGRRTRKGNSNDEKQIPPRFAPQDDNERPRGSGEWVWEVTSGKWLVARDNWRAVSGNRRSSFGLVPIFETTS
jgi:hypothetical protein